MSKSPAFTAMMIARNTTHGMSRQHPIEYRIWKNMRARCNCVTDSDYPGYGGRGISVDAAWGEFPNFFRDMGPRPEGGSIDRIDVNGNYGPDNCRWADKYEQANNRRSNHLIEWKGEKKTLQQWCNEIGIEPSKVRYRLKVGFPLDKAFSLIDHRKP